MPTAQKQKTVEALVKKLAQAKGVVLADYQGLNTAQINELRDQLKTVGCDFQIVKNTLLSLGLDQTNYSAIDIKGPTAVALASQDILTTLQVLNQYIEINQRPQIKNGFWEKEVLKDGQLEQLAKIPSLDHLKSMVLGQLGAPLSSLINALKWNLSQLVYVLQAIQERG